MGDGPGDPNDPDNPDNPDNPDDPDDPTTTACVGDGQSGAACDVSGDCALPQICNGGVCVAPRDPDFSCDPVEGVNCAGANEECIGGVCIANPGACASVDECPLGFVCSGGQCTPERDGSACADTGPGPNLTGTWKFNSTLHLRDGLPGLVDGVLDVS
jgi:hypothetical protein